MAGGEQAQNAVILEKVKEKAKLQGEPDTGETTGTLSDREETKMIPMKPAPSFDDEYCEDRPYEYESHRLVRHLSALGLERKVTRSVVNLVPSFLQVGNVQNANSFEYPLRSGRIGFLG